MSHLPFVPSVFVKVLAATLTAVSAGLAIALFYNGELAWRDIVGSLVSAPLLAYLIHLWITMDKDW